MNIWLLGEAVAFDISSYFYFLEELFLQSEVSGYLPRDKFKWKIPSPDELEKQAGFLGHQTFMVM
jgi:hypothetical protein